jgi:hypothetical protein
MNWEFQLSIAVFRSVYLSNHTAHLVILWFYIVIFPPRNENKLLKESPKPANPVLARERRSSERGKRAKSALCPHCGKEFRYLAQHIKLAHLGGVKFAPATCHICKKVYTQKSHLKQHVRAVHEQVRYQAGLSAGVADPEPESGKQKGPTFCGGLRRKLLWFFFFAFICNFSLHFFIGVNKIRGSGYPD